MDQATKDRLADRNIWARILYMLFFVIAYTVAETLLTLVVVFQFLAALITGRVNDALHQFGANLSAYVLQILRFATFNDEHLPYPFSDWPDEETGATPWSGPAPAPAQPSSAPHTDSAAADDHPPAL